MDAIPIQQWINEHPVDEKMYWRGGALYQVIWVRDSLQALLGADLGYPDGQNIATVISEHHSKSIALPVYSIDRPDKGLRVVLRDNFYNWKLSVISSEPIALDPLFPCLFHVGPPIEPDYTGDELHPVYFEGFPDDLIFGYFESNPCRWSAELHGDHALWTTIAIIARQRGFTRPRVWHTRESHQAELDAQSARWKADREKAGA